ncbi:hypothetical protein BS47DRAFT_1356264, partial [Hydnum rufescens UP504]
MPPIKEMLELTTNLHTQSMSDKDLASKDASQSVNPGFHLHSKEVNVGNKAYMPYGNEDERGIAFQMPPIWYSYPLPPSQQR